jgi:hypothetical protein
VDAAFGGTRWRTALLYLRARAAGCIGGAVVANLMFSLSALSISTKHRAGGGHFLSDVVATAGTGTPSGRIDGTAVQPRRQRRMTDKPVVLFLCTHNA